MTLSNLMGKFYEDIEFFGIIYEDKLYEVTDINVNCVDPPHQYNLYEHPNFGLYTNLVFILKDASPETPSKDPLNNLTEYYINYTSLLIKILSELMDKKNSCLPTRNNPRLILDMKD